MAFVYDNIWRGKSEDNLGANTFGFRLLFCIYQSWALNTSGSCFMKQLLHHSSLLSPSLFSVMHYNHHIINNNRNQSYKTTTNTDWAKSQTTATKMKQSKKKRRILWKRSSPRAKELNRIKYDILKTFLSLCSSDFIRYKKKTILFFIIWHSPFIHFILISSETGWHEINIQCFNNRSQPNLLLQNKLKCFVSRFALWSFPSVLCPVFPSSIPSQIFSRFFSLSPYILNT